MQGTAQASGGTGPEKVLESFRCEPTRRYAVSGTRCALYHAQKRGGRFRLCYRILAMMYAGHLSFASRPASIGMEKHLAIANRWLLSRSLWGMGRWTNRQEWRAGQS